MLIADDDNSNFYFKDKTPDVHGKKNCGITPFKTPVCHFFIPKITSKPTKIKKKTANLCENIAIIDDEIIHLDSNSKNEIIDKWRKEDLLNNLTINSIDSRNSCNRTIFLNEEANSNNNSNLTLISNPISKKSNIINVLKVEDECPLLSNSLDSTYPSSSLHSNSMPDLCISGDYKENSNGLAIKDFFSINEKFLTNTHNLNIELLSQIPRCSKDKSSCDMQALRSNLSPSHDTMTSSSCSVFTVNASALKLGSEDSCYFNKFGSLDEYHPYSHSEACSSKSSTNSLRVDIDRHILLKNESLDSMQPIVLLEKLQSKQSENLSSPIDYISIVSSSKSSDSRSTCSDISFRERYKNVNRGLKRMIQSDEETIAAISEKKSNVPSTQYESLEKVPFTSCPISTPTDFNSIYCFKCKVNLQEFCDKHQVEKIFNLNMDCPYIEYLIDESYNKYFQDPLTFCDCYCQQNELDHIQQSLPNQFMLRESNVSEIGIWTKVKITQGTLIGPYLGQVIEFCTPENLNRNRYETRGTTKFDCLSPCIEFAFKSNWLRCINFSKVQKVVNLKVLHYDQKVFFQATKNIEPDQELLVFNNAKFYNLNGQSQNDHIREESTLLEKDEINCTVLSDEDIENISFTGTKYSREMIIDIAKLWREYPQMTSAETIKIISKTYPKAHTLSERYLSKLARKYLLRQKGGSNTKFDSQMKEFIRNLLSKFPYMPALIISRKLKEQFPQRISFKENHLSKLISRYRIQLSRDNLENMNKNMIVNPKTHIENNIENINKKPVGNLSSRYSGLSSFSAGPPIKRNVKNSKIKNISKNDLKNTLSKSHDSLSSKINQEEILSDKTDFLIIENIRQITEENPLIRINEITKEIKRRFPKLKKLDIKTVKMLMKKNGVQPNFSNVKKIDDEMKRLLYQLRVENPHLSPATLNIRLRQLLPHKPYVQPNAIYVLLRKLNV